MRLVYTIVLLLCFNIPSGADEWPIPEIKRYYSINGHYMLKVIPTKIPTKYYQWREAKPKKKAKFSPSDTTIIHCHASFFKIDKDTTEIWTRNLINSIMPMEVIIADDGKSFVTFDNWSSLGYGPDVMVIYDGEGNLLKRYRLDDFTPFPLNSYTISVTSIWWRCGSNYIDNYSINICFQNDQKKLIKKQYNLTKLEFE